MPLRGWSRRPAPTSSCWRIERRLRVAPVDRPLIGARHGATCVCWLRRTTSTCNVSETRQLAQWVAAHQPADIPAQVVHQAKRALINYLAAALGGCRHEAVEIAVKT